MKKIRNLKLFAASFGLATSLLASNPMSVYAEEEVLFENTNEEHVEEDINNEEVVNEPVEEPVATEAPQEQITIDETNWNPADHPDEGNEILDYVLTEAERKGITPTPTPEDTPVVPDTPDVPSTPSEEVVTTPVVEETIVEKIVEIPKTGSNIVIISLVGATLIAVAINGVLTFVETCKDNKFMDQIDELKDEEEKKLGK